MSVCSTCKRYELCRLKGEDGELCSKFISSRAVRKKQTHEESRIQQECKKAFDAAYPGIKKLLFSVPNGADVSDRQRQKLVAEGMTAGVADMILLVPSANTKHHCLCLEFKKKTFKVLKPGTLKVDHTHQSPEQKDWQTLITMMGGRYEVVWSLEMFKEVIINYLEINNFK